MFFIMVKRVAFLVFMILVCVVSTGIVPQRGRAVEAQKRELIDVFIEKAEYVYNYILWFEGDRLNFTEKGYREKALQVDLYWSEGVYYFIPLKDCNMELEIEGAVRRVRYNKFQENRYIFCTLHQGRGASRDKGVWVLDYVPDVRREEAEKLTYLGTVELDVTGEEKSETMKLSENGYLRAIVDSIKNKGALPAGNYKVYIGWYGFVEANRVEVTGVIRQDETYRWFSGGANRNEDGSYDAWTHSTNGASEIFPTVEEVTFAYDTAMHIVEAERLVLDLEITGQEKWRRSQELTKEESSGRERIEVTVEEAEEKIKELYNYYHWFYGTMPYDIGALLEEGETYQVYTDAEGGIFWIKEEDVSNVTCGGIYSSPLQAGIEDLPLYSYTIDVRHWSEPRFLGTMEWHRPKLRKPGLEPLEEDEYIREIEAYITEELSEKKKDGKYQLYFGRYEILKDDVRSISVAVTGKDTFYLQCWVTRYPDGTYDCFPIGGSYMGEQTTGLEKVERIVQLERLKVELEVK